MTTQIFKDFEEFENRKDKTVNGLSEEFAEQNPNYEEDNKTNKGCWECKNCQFCKNCIESSDSQHCSDSSYLSKCRSCSRCTFCFLCEDVEDSNGLSNFTNPVRTSSPVPLSEKIISLSKKIKNLYLKIKKKGEPL